MPFNLAASSGFDKKPDSTKTEGISIDFKTLKDNFLQLKIAKVGVIKEIINPINRTFLEENVINKIKNNQDSLKNPAFREIFNKLNIN